MSLAIRKHREVFAVNDPHTQQRFGVCVDWLKRVAVVIPPHNKPRRKFQLEHDMEAITQADLEALIEQSNERGPRDE